LREIHNRRRKKARTWRACLERVGSVADGANNPAAYVNRLARHALIYRRWRKFWLCSLEKLYPLLCLRPVSLHSTLNHRLVLLAVLSSIRQLLPKHAWRQSSRVPCGDSVAQLPRVRALDILHGSAPEQGDRDSHQCCSSFHGFPLVNMSLTNSCKLPPEEGKLFWGASSTLLACLFGRCSFLVRFL